MWTKIFEDGNDDYTYFCDCGAEMDEDFYNSDTGHYECPECESESPDLENIEMME